MTKIFKLFFSVGLMVLSSACTQTVLSGGAGDSLLASPVPEVSATPNPRGPLSSLHCKVYDLAPYFVRQGCLTVLPNSLNDRQYGYTYDSLAQCQMRLPQDFTSLDGYRGEISVPNFAVEPTDWQKPFPGFGRDLEDLKEWYGMSCTGILRAPEDLVTKFKLSSDDGAQFFIDGRMVVDNGGILHATTTAPGEARLTRGDHLVHMIWYQGPRFDYALKLEWTYSAHRGDQDDRSARGDYEVIPASYFQSE